MSFTTLRRPARGSTRPAASQDPQGIDCGTVWKNTSDSARHAFRDVAPDAPVAEGLGSVRHALRRACARLKLAPLSPNDFRRSVAHWLLERGVPRDAAAAFMGHGSTKMLDLVYGKLDTKELGATIRRALELRGSIVEPG